MTREKGSREKDGPGFASRWSRLKQEAKAEPLEAEAEPAAAEPEAPDVTARRLNMHRRTLQRILAKHAPRE